MSKRTSSETTSSASPSARKRIFGPNQEEDYKAVNLWDKRILDLEFLEGKIPSSVIDTIKKYGTMVKPNADEREVILDDRLRRVRKETGLYTRADQWLLDTYVVNHGKCSDSKVDPFYAITTLLTDYRKHRFGSPHDDQDSMEKVATYLRSDNFKAWKTKRTYSEDIRIRAFPGSDCNELIGILVQLAFIDNSDYSGPDGNNDRRDKVAVALTVIRDIAVQSICDDLDLVAIPDSELGDNDTPVNIRP